MRFLTVFLLFISTFALAQETSPSFKKVVIVILENTDYAVAIKQPYLKTLIKQGAVFENFVAEGHPSQPNYVAMIAGDPMGVKDDGNVSLKGEHLGNLLEKKGLSWKNYAEDLPSPCFQGEAQAHYARKHVPFLSFENVLNDPQECAHVVNAQEFQQDERTGKLPTFSIYTPNLNNDGHDTNPEYADRWLAKEFGPKIVDPKFMKDLLLVITFDESLQYSGPNQILTLFVGSHIKPGSIVTAKTDHYDVLKTIEDHFQLGTLGRNDAKAKVINGIWK